MIAPSTIRSSLAVLAATAPLLAQTWFDLDASRPREQLLQSSKSLTLTEVGTVVDSTTHLVLGKGYYEVLDFTQPSAEPWYISARFRLDQYGDAESWYISSMASTATWPNSDDMTLETQGFELRIGGGRFYPQMDVNSLVSEDSRNGAYDYFTADRNALYSTCLLEIVTGTNDPVVEWAESYSSRCVERGVWHHVAAGWDGKRHVLFMDGQDVLDTNRVIGKGYAPKLESLAQLYFGHRRRSYRDNRYFHGAVQSIRMVSGVLDSDLAAKLYRQAFPAVQGTCDAVPVVDYPLTFQFAFADEMARMSLVPSPKCAEGETADLQLHPGDSIDVMAVSADGSGGVLGILTVPKLEFPLASFVRTTTDTQTVRLKARLRRNATAVAGRAMVVESVPWNDDRPIVITGKALGVRERASRSVPARLLGATSAVFPVASGLVARNPAGREIALGTSSRRADGAWDLSVLPRGFWVVSGGGASLRFVRF